MSGTAAAVLAVPVGCLFTVSRRPQSYVPAPPCTPPARQSCTHLPVPKVQRVHAILVLHAHTSLPSFETSPLPPERTSLS